MNFYTYDQYGTIWCTGSCQPENLGAYAKPGITVVAGDADARRQYVDVETGELKNYTQEQVDALSNPPGYGYNWRYGQWFDDRTQKEKDDINDGKTKKEIKDVESRQARAVREAILFGDTSLLTKIEEDIAKLRDKLKDKG